jgi:hypothetical protein
MLDRGVPVRWYFSVCWKFDPNCEWYPSLIHWSFYHSDLRARYCGNRRPLQVGWRGYLVIGMLRVRQADKRTNSAQKDDGNCELFHGVLPR